MPSLFPPTVLGDGPPLLFLHGGPGLSDYLSSMPAEETEGWQRIGYTQRGLEPSPVDGPFTVAQHVADALSVLDSLGLDDAVVLGHSWGGFLAAVLAMEHPDRVRGLVLVDLLGIAGDGGGTRFGEELTVRTPEESRRRAAELDERAMAGEGTEADLQESLRLLWPAYFADPASAPPMPADIRISIPCYSGTNEDLVRLLMAGELPGRAAAYDGPVEIVHGLGSPMPAEAATGTADCFAHSSLTGVADAGHFLWMEQPGSVAAALARLAARI
jgi:proline iminopeptidase